jgi:site-specific recombinase XerD
MSDLPPILQGFFTVKLMRHKNASPHTIASYRDTWKLLLSYAQQVTGTAPSRMRIAQLDHVLITGFLQYLETVRGNSASTRNSRLAAIHSMFRYAELHAPDDADTIRRVLAIEGTSAVTTDIGWLTPQEVTAVLAACDRGTWTGRRDHAIITILVATGLRVSELTGLTRADALIQAAGSHVHCTGKGRKERCTPLDPAAAAVTREWLEHTAGQPADPLFPARGPIPHPLTRDAIQARLGKYQKTAVLTCPSLAGKKITPHVLRHTRAMRMRAAGHDISLIALWLGHEEISSAQKYLHADMQTKERILDRTTPEDAPHGRYQPTDAMLDFLDKLTATTPPLELSRHHNLRYDQWPARIKSGRHYAEVGITPLIQGREFRGGILAAVQQVGDQAEHLRHHLAPDISEVLDDADGNGDAVAGQLREIGAVGQDRANLFQGNVAFHPDQHVRALDEPGDPSRAMPEPVHEPDPVRREQVRIVPHRRIQQFLLRGGLVRAGRAVRHPQQRPGGDVVQRQRPQARERRGIIARTDGTVHGAVRRRVRDPDHRPVQRPRPQRPVPSDGHGPPVPVLMLLPCRAQHDGLQVLQRLRAERVPPVPERPFRRCLPRP